MCNENVKNNKEDMVVCQYTNDLVPKNICSFLDGIGYVKNIYVNEYTYCDICDKYHSNDEINILKTGSNDTSYICDDCVEEGDYCFCEDCECYVSRSDWDEDQEVCVFCATKEIDEGIVGYHGYTDWSFKRTKEDTDPVLYMGFELEVEEREGVYEDLDDIAVEVRNMMNKQVFSSHDGSLNNGFEIVSNPMSLNFFRSYEDKIRATLSYLRGYCNSHKTSTCGLHVHVNKDWLGSNNEEIEKTINKLFLIMETFKDELIKVARRGNNTYSHYLLDDEDKEKLGEYCLTVSNIKKKRKDSSTRYMALNTQNRNTVEFRLFKGTLIFETFMSSIELVNTLCHIAKENKLEELDGLTWNDIINYKDNKYLAAYSASRGVESATVLKDYSGIYEQELKKQYEGKKVKYDAKIKVLVDQYNEIIRPIMNTDINVEDIIGKYNYVLGFKDVLGRVFNPDYTLDYSVKEEIKNKPNFPEKLGIEIMVREVIAGFIILTKEEKIDIGEETYTYKVPVEKVENELNYRFKMIKEFLA